MMSNNNNNNTTNTMICDRIVTNDITFQELIITEPKELYCCPNFISLCSALRDGTNTTIRTVIIEGRVIELMPNNPWNPSIPTATIIETTNTTATTTTDTTTTTTTSSSSLSSSSTSSTTVISSNTKNELTYFLECCSGLQNIQHLRLTISSDIVLTQRYKQIMASSVSYFVQQRYTTLQSICIVPLLVFQAYDITNFITAFTDHPTLQKIYYMNIIIVSSSLNNNSTTRSSDNNTSIPREGDDNYSTNNGSSSFWFDPILLAFATIPNLSYLHIMFGSDNNNNNNNHNNNNNNNNNNNIINNDSSSLHDQERGSQNKKTNKNNTNTNVVCTILRQRYNTLQCLYLSNYPFTDNDYQIIGATIQELNVQYDPYNKTNSNTNNDVVRDSYTNQSNSTTTTTTTTNNNNGCQLKYITLQSSITKQPTLQTYRMYYEMLKTNYTIEWIELMDDNNNGTNRTTNIPSSTNNNNNNNTNNDSKKSAQKLQKLFHDIQFLLLLNRYNRKTLVSYTSTVQDCCDTIGQVVESCTNQTIFQYNDNFPYHELDVIYEFVRCNPSAWIISSSSSSN